MHFLWTFLDFAKSQGVTSSLLAILFVVCIIHWIVDRYPEGKRLPPGPWISLPFVGYLPFIGSDYIKGFATLQKKYGPTYRLRLGERSVLVLNDFASIKEAFSQRAFLGRPPNPPNHILEGTDSMIISNGIIWQEQRRFAFRMLRNMGFGKSRMETHIKEEIAPLVKGLESFKGRPMNVRRFLAPSISNNISALIFGRRMDYHDPMRITLDKSLRKIVHYFRSTSAHAWFPWLKQLPFRFKLWSYDDKLIVAMDEIMNFIEKEIDYHKATLDPNSVRDYMDGFLLEMQQRQSRDPDTSFTMRMLKGNARLLISAGSSTLTPTVEWCLLAMAAHPEVQQRVFSEMEEVIGRERTPLWDDHVKLSYTQAALMEVQRWKTAVPMNTLRFTTEPTEVAGFYIPKGTTVIANIHAVHNDPSHWENPKEFRPERFLTPDGKAFKDEHWITFSLGKRGCPGKTLAHVEVFLYVTSLLQKFKIEFPEGKTHSFEGGSGAVFEPNPYELCMIPRQL